MLVSKDKAGQVTVRETGDHLGREGAAFGGGVGTHGRACRGKAGDEELSERRTTTVCQTAGRLRAR